MLSLDLDDATKMLIITRPTFLLVGRPGTGKSTLAGELVKNGYKHLELDKIVRLVGKKLKINDSSKKKTLFGDIYMGRASTEVRNFFINLVQQYMTKYVKYPIVVDGSLADSRIIKKIFKRPIVVFLYPNSVDNFARRILSRLHEDIKIKNYRLGESDEIIEEYKKNGVSKKIKKYVRDLSKLYTTKGQGAIDLFTQYNLIQVMV